MPYDYEFINTYNGTRTPTGTVEFDLNTQYFFRSLYQRALSIFNFNIPLEWNKNYFKNVLFGNGFIGIIRTDEYGIIPQICTLSGYGLYLQPTKILVRQPLVSYEGRIDDECGLLKITPDYLGICDIIEHYAIQLSKCFTSINVSLINSRVGFLAYAKNKQAAETLKVIAEKLSGGESLVITDKIVKSNDGMSDDEPLFTTAFDPANNYITDKLLDDFTTILNQFDREIGIPVIDDKKERRIETEVNTMISDTGTRLYTWKECLTESIEKTKKVFPELEISFSTSFDNLQRGDKNEFDTAPNANRSVQ